MLNGKWKGREGWVVVGNFVDLINTKKKQIEKKEFSLPDIFNNNIIFLCKNLSNPLIYFSEFALWLFPSNKDRNGELLKLVLTVIGGLGVLYSLYLSYKRMQATNIGLDLQSIAINKQSEQLELSRNGQVDERFKNAVEHLGNEKEPIILGGIVELHQIAKEDKDKYAAVVFNILTSFVRSNLKVKNKVDENFSPTIAQTIIDFLFKNEGLILYADLKANLSFCNLLSLDLSNSKFIKADFSFSLIPSEISNVDFSNSKFGKTEFTISKIKNTTFKGSDFHECFFNLCEFDDVDFSDSEMKVQKFISSKFYNVKFENSNLYEIDFILCHFDDLFLDKSVVLHSKFFGSNFINSFFTNSELTNVDFLASGFSLTFFNSDCFNCNFSGVRSKYDSEFIELEDIKNNIGLNTDKDVIKVLEKNLFEKCIWDNFKNQDYLEIEKEFNLAEENWKKKYELPKIKELD